MATDKKNKNISEQAGIASPNITNKDAAKAFKKRRQKSKSANTIVEGILNGDVSALSRGITLIESSHADHQNEATEIIKLCLPYSGDSIRIGITGVPGVGKSSFIEVIGNKLSKSDNKVAVLAVDPSSVRTKGSILGDKTRMETLVKKDNVFIRPTPSGESLGGVARKTRESIILCEAAGYKTIIIETVGVGQSEIAVHSMVDFFLLLKLAGAGDELQGIKRGIIEMADLIAINKADGDNLKAAKRAKQEFKNALHLYPPKVSGWNPEVLLCSALHDMGIDEVISIINTYFHQVKANEFFKDNRKFQQEFWLKQSIEERLKEEFYSDKNISQELQKQLDLINKGETTAFLAADALFNIKNNKGSKS